MDVRMFTNSREFQEREKLIEEVATKRRGLEEQDEAFWKMDKGERFMVSFFVVAFALFGGFALWLSWQV